MNGFTLIPIPRLMNVLAISRPKMRSTVRRVEICRNRHDQQSCKIGATCVNFPGKQRDFSHNFHRTTRFTHTKYNFALKLLRFYTVCKILSKKNTTIIDINAFTLLLLKIVTICALLMCKIFCLKIRSCNFFDKSQV